MTFAYIRISLLSARRASSSHTEQIGCMQTVNTRKISVGRNHVRNLLWLTMSCMSSFKKLFHLHLRVMIPGHVNTDRLSQTKHTNFMIWFKLCLNPYSEDLSCMSNDNSRISSLAVSHVTRLFTELLYVKGLTRTLW